jgi:hypothetical protein
LPVFVDDWVDVQRRKRGVSFEDLSIEALTLLREFFGERCVSRTPASAELATWLGAEGNAYGTGPADRVTEALCTMCSESTGADLGTMHNSGWRRLPETASLRPPRRSRAGEEPGAARERWAAGQRRSTTIAAAWRAAGSPEDPRKRWNKELAKLKISDDELFNVYVLPDRVAAGLAGSEASALLQSLQRSEGYRHRSVNDFVTWPARLEPIPTDWDARQQARLAWLRSLGVTAPHPDEDSPERRAWEAWQLERQRLRSALGASRGRDR